MVVGVGVAALATALYLVAEDVDGDGDVDAMDAALTHCDWDGDGTVSRAEAAIATAVVAGVQAALALVAHWSLRADTAQELEHAAARTDRANEAEAQATARANRAGHDKGAAEAVARAATAEMAAVKKELGDAVANADVTKAFANTAFAIMQSEVPLLHVHRDRKSVVYM